MATRFGCTISLAISGLYEQGALFGEVVQKLRARYEVPYTNGEAENGAEVVFAKSTTNSGVIQTYNLAPLIDVFGNSNTWKKLRTIIVKNNDDPTSSRRLFLGGTAWGQTFNLAIGSPQQNIRAGQLYVMDAPGTVPLVTIVAGSFDTITITWNGAFGPGPVSYDLWLIGTK